MKNLILLIPVLFLFSCATNKTPTLDSSASLDEKGTIGGSRIGLNKDSEAIIQTEKEASQEFVYLTYQNSDLEDKFKGTQHLLMDCRESLAMPENGGDGQIKPIPELAPIKEKSIKITREFGLLRGRLYTVEKQNLKERLEVERKYNEELTVVFDELFKIYDQCQRRLRLNKAALKQ